MIPVDKLVERLASGAPVRRRIGTNGRINIDRQLPFLCLYRQPEKSDWGTRKLVQSEASYLVLPRDVPTDYARRLLLAVVETLADAFGAFLIIDVRASIPLVEAQAAPAETRKPSFVISADVRDGIVSTVGVMKAECQKIVVQRRAADVMEMRQRRFAGQRLAPLVGDRELHRLGCRVVGLDVAPNYRDEGHRYPLVLRALRHGLSRALKRAVHEFGRSQTRRTPPNYLALGKRAFAKAVFKVDAELAEIDNSFDFLLQTTPTNADEAWHEFSQANFEHPPHFAYRPLPFDPSVMKRRLFRVPIERIEDPTIEHLLMEKQHELDNKLSLMWLIGTKRFMYGSMQLFGAVEPSLRRAAEDILATVSVSPGAESKLIGARSFARMVSREIAHYQTMLRSFAPVVEVREDLYAGLLVSRGSLLIGKRFATTRKRARALINHEVGTHLLTYHNGREQPFKQLAIGLAGYDELQEGLGVLSEYLVGGFSRNRLRMLAGRVIAVDELTKGAGMVEIFRILRGTYGFSEKIAFGIALRVCRGGGLTKDAVYLRGLLTILEYLRGGGSLEVLFIGKIGVQHIPLIKELQWRKVLAPMKLVPRVLSGKRSRERLITLRSSEGLDFLVQGERRGG